LLSRDNTPLRFAFDSTIPGANGKGDCLFYYVQRAGQLFCAKVGQPDVIKREYDFIIKFNSRKHPSLVTALHLIEDIPGRHALIMPLYGVSLSHFVSSVDNITAINVVISILAAIKLFHDQGYCHGDIKPSNIMLQTITSKEENLFILTK
jgi:serine/threonine protein kinase